MLCVGFCVKGRVCVCVCVCYETKRKPAQTPPELCVCVCVCVCVCACVYVVVAQSRAACTQDARALIRAPIPVLLCMLAEYGPGDYVSGRTALPAPCADPGARRLIACGQSRLSMHVQRVQGHRAGGDAAVLRIPDAPLVVTPLTPTGGLLGAIDTSCPLLLALLHWVWFILGWYLQPPLPFMSCPTHPPP